MGKASQLIVLFAAGFVIIFGGLAYGVYTRRQQNEKLREEVAGMEAQIAAFTAKTARRKELEDQYDAIERRFADVVDILPFYSPEQRDSVLDHLTSYASLSNLKFRRIVVPEEEAESVRPEMGMPGPGAPALPVPPPQAPEFGQQFEPTELSVVYQGTFFNFLKFLSLIEQRKEFLRVDSVVLRPAGRGAGGAEDQSRMLDIEIKLSTFHFKPPGVG